MKTLFARQALLPEGWATDVTVAVQDDGRIGGVTRGSSAEPAGTSVGVLLPAPVNVHSHAFQRAMAGLTERRGPVPGDSFWTWRQLMFRFLDRLTPDDVQAIAAFVQMEMLEAGYATNVEFHYLHHQPGGKPYGELAEMAQRIVAASHETGIGLTLLPVHYRYGGCDKRPLGDGQIRFGTDPELYAELFAQAESAVRNLPADCGIGVAPHSLRAVSPDSLPDLLKLADGRPIHMHLAEQIAEVSEVATALGKRPVEWLLDNIDVDRKWCLIHCTQMEPHETAALAATGAVAGLCPITESNLGDGIFDGIRWFENNGRIAIGSDSNVRISLSEELRTLEYTQRLRDHSRAALASPDKSTARRLLDEMLAGGAQAAGRQSGRIEPGCWADMMALDDDAIDLQGKAGDALLDGFVFAGDDSMVRNVWSAGRHMVRDGTHIAHDAIAENYRRAMHGLRDAL